MFDYLHDEWCATKLDGSPDCDCVRQILLDKDAQVAQLEQRVEGLEDVLRKIVQWSEAYPLDIFPEPDFEKARKLLKDGGMTIDGISASNMRHVITEVAKIAKAALPEHLK